MARIVGSGGPTPPVTINSTESIQQAEETKASKNVETPSNVQSENKAAPDRRAVAEHKMMGNLQQMKLNSMFDLVPLKGGSEPTKAWNFENGYPIKWEGPDFDSDNEVKTEPLEIAHQGFLDETKAGKIEYPNLSFYVPEPQDTLQTIASKFGLTEEALAQANNLKPGDALPAGIQLKINTRK